MPMICHSRCSFCRKWVEHETIGHIQYKGRPVSHFGEVPYRFCPECVRRAKEDDGALEEIVRVMRRREQKLMGNFALDNASEGVSQ